MKWIKMSSQQDRRKNGQMRMLSYKLSEKVLQEEND